jgi:hypothetical protein
MHVDVLSVLSLFSAAPFVAIAAILCLYLIRRVPGVRSTRTGRRLFGLQPAAVGLGMAFLFLQVFWRPSLSHVIEVQQKVDVEEDDEGDPESLTKQLHRQLRRIRRGEPVERLVLRL